MKSPCEHKGARVNSSSEWVEGGDRITILHMECGKCFHLFCRDSARRLDAQDRQREERGA